MRPEKALKKEIREKYKFYGLTSFRVFETRSTEIGILRHSRQSPPAWGKALESQKFSWVFGKPPLRPWLSEPCHGPNVQFSVVRLRTRPNSPVLFVTNVTPKLRACAAMNKSFAPIIVPRRFKSPRIFA